MDRRDELDTKRELLAYVDDHWLQWEYLPHYRNWDSLVPKLYEECEAGGAPITDYHADGLFRNIEHAIPVIVHVEMAAQVGSVNDQVLNL